jgi:hypothetical protein
MTATSGSITQNKSYVQTTTALEGLPDDAFMEGDLAFVGSVGQTYRLRRSTTTGFNGSSILRTYSGNGFWELFPPGGSMVVVENIAELVALDDLIFSLESQVFVRSVRSPFWLRDGSGPEDGITVVVGSSGTRTWYRDPVVELWVDRQVYYIDNTNGNDEALGDSVGTAIASLRELQRRTYTPGQNSRSLSVYVVGDLNQSGTRLTLNNRTYFYGVRTPVVTDAAVSNTVDAKKTAACIRQEMTSAGLPMLPGNLIKFSSGESGWAVSDKSELDDAYTRIFDDTGALTIPAAPTTASEYQLPYFNAHISVEGNVQVRFTELQLGGTIQNASEMIVDRCVVTAFTDFISCTGSFHESNFVGRANFVGCPQMIFRSATVQAEATGTDGYILLFNTSAIFEGDCGVVTGQVWMMEGGILEVQDDLELSVSAIVSARAPNTQLGFATLGYIWGLGGSTVVLLTTNIVMTFLRGSHWTADGIYEHADGAGGTTSDDLNTLPATPSLASMPNYKVGIIPST